MRKTTQFILTAALVVVGLAGGVALGGSDVALAATAQDEVCKAIGGCTNGGDDVSGVIKTVIDIMSAIGSVIAVIMIIIGGIKYVTSNGDSNATASAKNTIIYALVGLVIVAFAQIIVQFVLERST